VARVLFLTQVLPYPLDAGPKVRAYHMLRHLSGSHEVTLLSFVRDDDAPSSISHLRSLCRAVYTVPMRRSMWRNARAAAKGLITGTPIVVARDEIQEMQAAVRRLAAELAPQVVHADQLSMAGYGRLAATPAAGRTAPRTVLDEHNAIYLLTSRMASVEARGWRRAIMAREAGAFRRYEARMCRFYDAILTVTREDRDHLLALYPAGEREAASRKFTVVPICVDPAQVAPVARALKGPPTILHLGTMFWPPNVEGVLWFAREVLPLVRLAEPDARFVVVGKNPPAEVMALTAEPGVEVTGYVADVAPYLSSADAFVAPLHAGGGMRVKILDAWLWGQPVVSTPIGAEGIDIRDGENILIGADAAGFAAQVVRLLRDPELNGRVRAAGRAWVETHYAWKAAYQQVDRIYAGLLTHGSDCPSAQTVL